MAIHPPLYREAPDLRRHDSLTLAADAVFAGDRTGGRSSREEILRRFNMQFAEMVAI
jgi:hypothetical protein